MSRSEKEIFMLGERLSSLEIRFGKKHDNSQKKYKQNCRRAIEIPRKTLLMVFRLAARVLDTSEILVLLTLNKDINQLLLQDKDLLKYICVLNLRYTSLNKLTASNVLSHFNSLTGLNFSSHKRLFKSTKNAGNLIKNPSFHNQLNFWDNEPGGSGFGFEIFHTFKDREVVLTTSYDWCIISQDIRLPEGGIGWL